MLSDVTEIALADYPDAPASPVKVNSMSSESSIYVEWSDVAFTQINVIGYELWMDQGSNGFFTRLFDGRNKPGIMDFTVDGLQTGLAYQFKVRAINFNGVGEFSPEVTYYSCLAPEGIIPPQYVSSTETSLRVKWSAP